MKTSIQWFLRDPPYWLAPTEFEFSVRSHQQKNWLERLLLGLHLPLHAPLPTQLLNWAAHFSRELEDFEETAACMVIGSTTRAKILS